MSIRSGKRVIIRKRSGSPFPPVDDDELVTREEFERRYGSTPPIMRAELIEGRIYLQPTGTFAELSSQRKLLCEWFSAYESETEGVEAASSRRIRLDQFNEPQPDGMLRIYPSRGGQSRTADDGWVEGPPELLAEVVSSSSSYALHEKLELYRRAGVREYLVWLHAEEDVAWFKLDGGHYGLLQPDGGGAYASEIFAGLRLHLPSLVSEKLVDVLRGLRRGVGTLEHSAFVNRLANASYK